MDKVPTIWYLSGYCSSWGVGVMLYDCSCVLNSKMSVMCQLLLVISTNLVLMTRVMNLAKCDLSSSLGGLRLSGSPVGSAGPL